eukprot:TRINITY_DN4130_c0_g1_i2.p1 TRINITY_DN4130_c0_g1~~TRINITY_DN4130_c0_g1_i2.p1  ORF type:complete len:701 (+),score=232.61 TRINITY_DN4130_c0_g1_i2:88-2103(+)
MSNDAAKELFLSIGLDKKRAIDTLANAELTSTLEAIIKEAGKEGGCDKSVGNLLYEVAVKYPVKASKHKSTVVVYIGDGRIKSVDQLKEAFKFVSSVGDADFDTPAFEKASGVGITVTADQISAAVAKVIAAKKGDIQKKRYQFQAARLIGTTKQDASVRWAETATIKREIEAQVATLLGPKTEADIEAAKPKGKKGKAQQEKQQPPKAADKAVELEASKKIVLVNPSTEATRIKIRCAKENESKRVRISGWVDRVSQGSKKGLLFVELRDGTGYVQCVLTGDLAKTYDALTLRRESTATVWGTLVTPPGGHKARGYGLELQADYWQLVHAAPADFEGKVNVDESRPETIFNNRHLAIRDERTSAYLRLRSSILQHMRQYYFDNGFVEVQPPTIVQTQAEGGSELFEVDYFGEKAYLTQSSQLYLETVLPAVGDTFSLVSSYRAEPSRTRRHLAEYTHLEAELAFINFSDLLEHLEDFVCNVIQRVLDSPHGDLLRKTNPDIAVPKRPFKRLEYTDALTFCRENNIYKDEKTKEHFEFGDDIPEGPERKMVLMIGEPTFLCRFPLAMKAFYMPAAEDDARLSESCDLLMPGVGEVVGGSMRIHDYDELMAAYKREGLDASPYYWYTDQRKYGSCPHGGYGLGVERMLVWLFGDDHIKNVCLYPRYKGRCTP